MERNKHINLSTIFRKLLINLICSCGDDIKNYSHYPIYCSDYLQGRAAFLNTVKCIAPNILDLNNFQLTEILLYDKENLDNITNTSILDATFRCFFFESKRSDSYYTDKTFKSFIFVFLYFFFIVISLLFLGYFFYFFIPRYVTTYMYTWWL